MALSATIRISFAPTDTGLTLSAQLKDTAGTNVGSAITTGFVEIGGGEYWWTYGNFGDAFRGGVVFTGGPVQKSVPINPEELSAGGGGNNTGPGADTVTIQLWANSPTNTIPLADADVWVTSDANGSAVVAGTLQTNSDGEAVFLLDAGSTYYLWVQKDGVNSIQGESFVAVAD